MDDLELFKQYMIDETIKVFPQFLILLTTRTVEESLKFTKLSSSDFIENVEHFLYNLICIADYEDFLLHGAKPDIDDYRKRRLKFLTALGLDEYIAETTVSIGNSALELNLISGN